MGQFKPYLISHLIRLLDKKRDGLLLLDGRWGTGKTYFIKNIFPQYYKSKCLYHISLLGIKSLSDFKAKIIDCYYLHDVKTLKAGIETLSGVASISSGMPASANVINGIFSSIGSSIQENILSKISGLFILDDIERIKDEEFIHEILTYCHTLYSLNDGDDLDFLIITNSSKESNLNISHIEKIISNTLHYTPTITEILDIEPVKNKLEHLPDQDIKILVDILNNHSIVNIRIISRILDKLSPLYIFKNEQPNLIWKAPSHFLVSSISSFFILLFLYDATLEDIQDSSYYTYMDPDPKMDSQELKYWSLLNSYQTPKEIKSYCSGYISEKDLVSVIFTIPQSLSISDIALSTRPELQDIDEKKLYIFFIDALTKKEPISLANWLKALINYEYLTFHQYMPKSTLLTIRLLIKKLRDYTDQEVIKYYEAEHGALSEFSTASLPISIAFINHLNKRHNRLKRNITITKIKKSLETHGWAMFNTEYLTKIDDYAKYRLLDTLQPDFITKCIFIHWNVKDIESFNAFLQQIYRISNISDYALNEKQHLIYLNQKIELFMFKIKKGFKFGAACSLQKTLKYAITRL